MTYFIMVCQLYPGLWTNCMIKSPSVRISPSDFRISPNMHDVSQNDSVWKKLTSKFKCKIWNQSGGTFIFYEIIFYRGTWKFRRAVTIIKEFIIIIKLDLPKSRRWCQNIKSFNFQSSGIQFTGLLRYQGNLVGYEFSVCLTGLVESSVNIIRKIKLDL